MGRLKPVRERPQGPKAPPSMLRVNLSYRSSSLGAWRGHREIKKRHLVVALGAVITRSDYTRPDSCCQSKSLVEHGRPDWRLPVGWAGARLGE